MLTQNAYRISGAHRLHARPPPGREKGNLYGVCFPLVLDYLDRGDVLLTV